MTALALAERLDMPRLASDVRTTLAALDRGSPESLVVALQAAIDRRPSQAPPTPSSGRCSCSATTTSDAASSPRPTRL